MTAAEEPIKRYKELPGLPPSDTTSTIPYSLGEHLVPFHTSNPD